ncbi:MAG: hypothetical protein M1812_007216 [Candelaria pacifica]|nr:MAG: hypothetical protein M1812_007216 [Candelaria pacifica]
MHTPAGEPASRALTEANLRQQNEDQQYNMAYAERVVREEQTQNYHRQTYYSRHPQQEEPYARETEECSDNEHIYKRILNNCDDLKLFAQRQSGEVPIERFANLDPTNDPTGFMERIAMREIGIGPGEMDRMEQRKSGAERIARDTKRPEAQQAPELQSKN